MNMSATDVDFTDPSLAYGTISWQIEYATALKLLQLPGQGRRRRRSQIQPEGAAGFPVVSKDGKTYTSPSSPGSSSATAPPSPRRTSSFAMNRALSPTMQSPAAAVHRPTSSGAQAVIDGKAKTAVGRQGQGQQARHQADAAGRRTPGQARHAVLPGDPDEPGARPAGRQRLPVRRPVLHREPRRPAGTSRSRRTRTTRARARANVDTFDITVNTNLDQSLLQVEVGSGRLRHGRPAGDGARRPRLSSSASTRAATSSTRSSRPTTSP